MLFRNYSNIVINTHRAVCGILSDNVDPEQTLGCAAIVCIVLKIDYVSLGSMVVHEVIK